MQEKTHTIIETNSLNKGFDFDLIDTMFVKKSDTILFRKWEVDANEPVFVKNKIKEKFKVISGKYVSYYKTGERKFAKYSVKLEGSNKNEIFSFYTYVDLGIDKDPYDQYNFSSYVRLEKLNDSVGRFDMSRLNRGAFYMDFQIIDKDIVVTRLVENPSYFNKNNYELDTIIRMNKNLVDIGKLYDVVRNKKNIKN
ncbi:hypothetical protein OAT18_00130 [Tenacibaculum sp.]|nr:hypothetical protein [Tenacibaculum sp.]